MPELQNRDELEVDFAKKFGKVARRHMREFQELLGDPADIENVPPEFWERMKRESEDSTLWLLLLIFSASANQHGWTGVDMGLAAMGWATARAKEFAEYWTGSSQDRMRTGLEKLRNGPLTDETTIDQARETNRLKPSEPHEPTREELRELLDKTFGPKRIEGVAIDETTRARHAGGEAGVDATVGLSGDDVWKCDWRHDKVCKICAPLDNQPRSVWSLEFPDGPPDPHHLCRCWIQYENSLVPAVKAWSLKSRWITLKPHGKDDSSYVHVMIDDDGKIEAGPKEMEGRNVRDLSGTHTHEKVNFGVFGKPKAEFISDVHKAVMSIPKQLIDKIGVKISAAHRFADAIPDEANNRPRGWPEGTTWSNADGCYSHKDSIGVLACNEHLDQFSGEWVKSGRTEYLVRHEYGHAVDHKLEFPSKTNGDFVAAYAGDVTKLLDSTGSNVTRTGYFLNGVAAELEYLIQPSGGSNNDAGRSEAFAEAFAAIHGGGCYGRAYLKKHFPRTIEAVKKIVNEHVKKKSQSAEKPKPDSGERDQTKNEAPRMMRAEGSDGMIGDMFVDRE